MIRDTEIAVLTTAPSAYDYTRVTRELLTDVLDKHGTPYRLVAIDQDPSRGTFGVNQCDRYGSGLYAAYTIRTLDRDLDGDLDLSALGLPTLDALLIQASAKHDTEIRGAVRALAARRLDANPRNDGEVLANLARAVALILMIDAHPSTNPEDVRLTKMTRYQLRDALGLEEE